MSPAIFVTGTDTNVGKTVFCAGLARLLNGYYWKPIQSGLESEPDSDTVRRLSGLSAERILPEAWRLKTPASPHLAAEIDGVTIDPDGLMPPATDAPLVVEGAGGVLVPVTREVLFADVVARWRMPAVLCTRTTLGTINHTLLSIEALRSRHIPILGVALIGAPHAENQKAIAKFGKVPILGRLPTLRPLNADTLSDAFATAFNAAEILAAAAAGGPHA
jgi:dethiobiotin synthetase